MSELEQRVAERLHALAGRAGEHDPEATLAAVAAAGRDRRRRVLGCAAGVVLLGLLLTTGWLTRPAHDDRTSAATSAARVARPELYDLRPRGPLAGDAGFTTRLAARTWSSTDDSAADRAALLADPADRRVVYAADVPGGHRWAVVVGRAAGEWVYAWFAGPAGADAGQLQLAAPVAQLGGAEPLALIDVSASPAPLVVLGRPGDEAEYSAGTERAPDGDLTRDYIPLTAVDGVPAGAVPTPIAWGSGVVVLLRDGRRRTLPLVTTGSPPTLAVTWGPNSPDPAVLSSCLRTLGLTTTVAADGTITITAPPGLSSAEEAARDAAMVRCQALATGGG